MIWWDSSRLLKNNYIHHNYAGSMYLLTRQIVTISSLYPYLFNIGLNTWASVLLCLDFTATVFLFGKSNLNRTRSSTLTSCPPSTDASSSSDKAWKQQFISCDYLLKWLFVTKIVVWWVHLELIMHFYVNVHRTLGNNFKEEGNRKY